MKKLLGLWACLIALPLFATAVSTACYPTPAASHTGFSSSSCSSTDSVTGAQASASAVLTTNLGSNGGFTQIHLGESDFTSFGAYPGQVASGVNGHAASAINYQDTFLTKGPVRQGYIELAGTIEMGRPYDGTVKQNFSMTSLNPNEPTPTMYCDGSSCQIGYYISHPRVPVMLGIPFTISEQLSMEAYADFQDGISGGILTADINFRFFEADAATPVDVSQAPEPSTFALLGLPLAAALIARRQLPTQPLRSRLR